MAILFPDGNQTDTYTASNGVVYKYEDGAWRISSTNFEDYVHMSLNPPNNPEPGDLWFHTGEADMKVYYADPNSEQWVPASSPPDPYAENFVSVTGDSMLSNLHFTTNSGIVLDNSEGTKIGSYVRAADDKTKITAFAASLFQLSASDANGTNKISIRLQNTENDGEVKKGNGMNLWNVVTPSDDYDGANKIYVDGEIKKAIDNLKTNDSPPTGVPGLAFKYATTTNPDTIVNGEFLVGSNNEIHISQYSREGVQIADVKVLEFTTSINCAITIRGSDKKIAHQITTKKILQGVSSNNHITYTTAEVLKSGKDKFNKGSIYWITDGFFLT